MVKLSQRLAELEQKSRKLQPNEQERNELLSNFNKTASDFLNNIESTKAYSTKKADPNLFKLEGSSVAIKKLNAVIGTEVMQKGINAASGGHLGYIPGGGIYASAIGDYLAAVSNAYSGMYYASPGAVEMEHACLNWLKELFEFPLESVGNLTSGGSIANLIALTAARDFHNILDFPVSESVVYLSKQTHHCIHKALRIIGLGKVTIREVELDEGGRIIPEKLNDLINEDLRNDLKPFMVIASAGTTDTGAVDPLNQIAEISKKHGLWYHVDAAYGGFFKLLPEKNDLFKGIEKADSLVIDPHKGLFLPYGIGAVLVKNKQSVLQSHHYIANYMQDATADEFPVNPADVSPELTKHFRALRMWLPMKIHGIQPFIAALEEKLLLTEYFRQKIVDLGFSVGPEPDLSVSYFWYPKGENQNEFNQQLMQEIHKDGEVFLSSTTIDGDFVIRVAILSFRTHRSTIDKALKMIERCLNEVRKE